MTLGEIYRFPRRRPQLVPPEDLRLIVLTLMELLKERRGQFDLLGRGLRRRYEEFACALRTSGFRFNETATRKARGIEWRRLGELAEQRGNIAGAIACYEFALRSYSDIGCRRAVARLRTAVSVIQLAVTASVEQENANAARSKRARSRRIIGITTNRT